MIHTSPLFNPPPQSEMTSQYLYNITRLPEGWLSLSVALKRCRVQLKRDGTRWRTGGEGRGNWLMEWVASTLHTTSQHWVPSITTADAHTAAASSRLNWRPPANLNGLVRFAKRRNLFSARVPSYFKRSLLNLTSSQYSSNYLGTWCIQHYYRWCAHLGCQKLAELTSTPI
jgi:hypothetical protein